MILGFTEEEIALAGVEFYLEAFNTTVQMDVLADLIDGNDIPSLTGFDATGVLYISKTLMNEVFTVKLVGDLNDLNNVNITGLLSEKGPSHMELQMPAKSMVPN